MKRLLLGLMTAGAVGGVAMFATGAFFSDTETSTGNVLAAGDIDLKIDNTSYYNGESADGSLEFQEGTSWVLADLTNEVFFNFRDLKPGDFGEDTISIHVGSNPAWVCVDIDATANDDVNSTDPELTDGDVPENPANLFDGELAQALNFMFWTDDGDNVLETGEEILTQGSADAVLGDVRWPIADSSTGEPLPGDSTIYIGKAFCFGNLTEDRLGQDGPIIDANQDSIPDNGPDTRGAGVACDGSQVNNLAQTDLLSGDITFEAVQSRHNLEFLCNPVPEVLQDQEG